MLKEIERLLGKLSGIHYLATNVVNNVEHVIKKHCHINLYK